ncbi:unnamed protein product [Zymoseptoria tritici ST99CH_1A5]|uniref:Protein NO VEIN C-terminal domain-containing protein n=1 Tax=Zymoseptoria tritici ST99CH_1A5 TaxID=1276529 RepID=A0A1Y6LCX7_ZYMTR|nr:unnamed protein product [Zymoseptoria tritici ST99CH_1A5]
MIAGHAIITLAQNIYGSDARFVFELLQNADDNCFEKATAAGAAPFVSFHVYSDRIVVECNEDGFTLRNLTAICAVGQSSKSTTHGYIGAKGIGFKSVFIAAWKVHVQSGHFSFDFKHKKGDSGLGMVVPIWHETSETLPSPMTRMTLYLHETKGAEHLNDIRKTVFEQLSSLQETSLLFLRKLKKINVSFYDANGHQASSKLFQCDKGNDQNVRLETVHTTHSGATKKDTKRFHVTTHLATGLSASESRGAAPEAEVILAFPLTHDLKPLLEKQELFAFLPVRKSEFEFIIHSDFDTTASRQDIMTTSRRNRDLLNAIADAFKTAVTEFCGHPELCYTWPNFLPSPQSKNAVFWSALKDRIQQRLCKVPMLKARHGDQLRRIDSVVMPHSNFLDEAEKPLLDYDAQSAFISPAYAPEARAALKHYGLESMNFGLAMILVRADLNFTESIMKSQSTSEHWHSRMAQFLRTNFSSADCRLRGLELVPLSSGDWTSLESGALYLPTVRGIKVPSGLNIRILDSRAAANIDRREFFMKYGVEEPSVISLRRLIVAAVRKPVKRRTLSSDIGTHAHFLYLSHFCEPELSRTDVADYRLYTSEELLRNPREEDVFLPTKDLYGASELLKAGHGFPGLDVAFVHPWYLSDIPIGADPGCPSWNEWLYKTLEVRQRLRLVARGGKELSEAWTYVATHRPDKALGLLEHLWKYEGSLILKNDKLKLQIMDMCASRLCSPPLDVPWTLQQTYIPLAALKAHRERFMEPEERFPFLDLYPDMASAQLLVKWDFLHEAFSVGIDDDLRFFLDVLLWVKISNKDCPKIPRHERLIDVYVAIYAKCAASPDRERAQYSVRETPNLVYIPPLHGRSFVWAAAEDCFWDGPTDTKTKHSLKYIYSKCFGDEQTEHVARFFCDSFRLDNATLKDLIEELRHLAEHGEQDFDRVLDLYRRIAARVGDDEAWAAMKDGLRQAFSDRKLIFVPKGESGTWCSTSECIWSSSTSIKGKVTLQQDYEDLENFFVDIIGVKRLTLQIIDDEILGMGSETTITEVKSAVRCLNSVLQSSTEQVDREPLLRKSIFPFRLPDGSKTLANAGADFSVGDRDYLIKQFSGLIKLLDFEMEEVQDLRPFLEWTRIANRCLSVAMKERTFVGPGSTRPVVLSNLDLKRKAYAFLRVAANFRSPRYAMNGTGFYQELRSLRTLATNEIRSVSSLFQDGKSVELESQAGDVHIEALGDAITVYVPRNKAKQQVCYASKLPEKLAAWIMQHPITNIEESVDRSMISVLTAVLSVTPSVLSPILDHQGIIQLSIADADPETDNHDDTEDESVSSEDEAIPAPQASPSAPEPEVVFGGAGLSSWRFAPRTSIPRPNGDTSEEPVSSEEEEETVTSSRAYTGSRGSLFGRPLFSPGTSAPHSNASTYQELLQKVVRAARTARFPSKGAFSMSALRSALPEDDAVGYNGFEATDRYHPINAGERNFEIGAAGELYVFEIFSNLSPALRCWSRENWQSTIRHRVSVHPDYTGLERWSGKETADLVYDDVLGELTKLLIDRGYLASNEWDGRRPFYYIEVKTTTGSCEAPFYMSKGQYERMTEIHNKATRAEIYMVLRVFEIENERKVAMKVYIDPAQHELDRQLVFTGGNWTVTPGVVGMY